LTEKFVKGNCNSAELFVGGGVLSKQK